MSRWSLAAVLLLASPLAAQAAPGTDIWLMPLHQQGGARPGVGPAVNLTVRAGYDNQPFFSPDGKSVYYTSQRDGQTDIFR